MRLLGQRQQLFDTRLQPSQSRAFAETVEDALGRPEMDLDDFVARVGRLDLPEGAKRRVARGLDPRRFPLRTIPIDAEVVRRVRRRKRIFQGDFGVRVEIPQDFPEERWRVRRTREADKFGGSEFYVVTIETETWRPRA